ncbi:alpha/beta hydrolase [Aequorivita sp. H23M31]|uniref:Alpha/beta hydrolase n=1 Tax=Aequorivita ciconiae TaxID=2494375 RepID=A0A410FZC9_9FLAO|nr:YqiA/YcfP family alpha/beta fold hydrolase [Aequorivita sp. H23M31]QAA80368.1 alpha/beta hydrolase [Aequorivita sp. H23M31]
MNILYLHGLDGDLAPEKRTILQKYGKVLSPAIDYRTEYNSIELLVEQFKNEKINAVIGSSLGGFVGYYVADAYKISSLLFNPALASRSVSQKIPNFKNPYLSFKQIVLGAQDTVINPRDTFTFLSKNLQEHTNYDIHVRQDLGHQITIQVFKEEVEAFFKKI